jgi:hypothetical protein
MDRRDVRIFLPPDSPFSFLRGAMPSSIRQARSLALQEEIAFVVIESPVRFGARSGPRADRLASAVLRNETRGRERAALQRSRISSLI